MMAKMSMLAMLAVPMCLMAQAIASCDPLNGTCPSNPGLTKNTFTTDFTKGENTSWTVANYTTVSYSKDGAAFTVNTKTDAPTLSTDFYIFFGYVEVKARAAPGTGIVSSIVLQSDDLDEIDWEWLGGTPDAVQTNFFGKGNTTTYNRMVSVPVSTATTTYHTYALNWTSTSLTWLIDGTPVRTLLYSDAIALNGKNYPQTPCKLKLGIWAGGASENKGTVDWAGGATDFSKAPFTMMVQSVKVVNYSPAQSYTYSDRSGDWTSIKIENPTDASSSSSSKRTTVESRSLDSSGSIVHTTTTDDESVSAGTSASTSSTITSTSTTAEASFVQGINGAMRQIGSGSMGTKIIYALMAVLGVFLA